MGNFIANVLISLGSYMTEYVTICSNIGFFGIGLQFAKDAYQRRPRHGWLGITSAYGYSFFILNLYRLNILPTLKHWWLRVWLSGYRYRFTYWFFIASFGFIRSFYFYFQATVATCTVSPISFHSEQNLFSTDQSDHGCCSIWWAPWSYFTTLSTNPCIGK